MNKRGVILLMSHRYWGEGSWNLTEAKAILVGSGDLAVHLPLGCDRGNGGRVYCVTHVRTGLCLIGSCNLLTLDQALSVAATLDAAKKGTWDYGELGLLGSISLSVIRNWATLVKACLKSIGVLMPRSTMTGSRWDLLVSLEEEYLKREKRKEKNT